jgi:hypothetical protein
MRLRAAKARVITGSEREKRPMYEILPSREDVIALRCSGRLDRAELEAMTDLIEQALEARETTHVYAELIDISGFDTDGIGDLMKRAGRMMGKLRRFGRIAVVADQAWVRWAARFESAVLPHVSYETFELKDAAQARAWVDGEARLPHGPAVRIIETDRPEVLGFELDGKASRAELDAAAVYFNRTLEALEGLGPVRMLGRIRQIAGFELGGLFSSDYFAMKKGFLGRLDRYAVVGGPAWLKAMVGTMNPLFKAELRWFEPDAEDEAWAWLGATPVRERALES